jgi:hypothetical protein
VAELLHKPTRLSQQKSRVRNRRRNVSSLGPPEAEARDANAGRRARRDPCRHGDRVRTVGVSRGGGDPAAGDRVELVEIVTRRHDVVLRDDRLVEPVDALVGERERGVETPPAGGTLDLERGCGKRDAAG